MKKITFAAIAAVAAVMVASCGNNTPRASLKTDVDTLSYALGMSMVSAMRWQAICLNTVCMEKSPSAASSSTTRRL